MGIGHLFSRRKGGSAAMLSSTKCMQPGDLSSRLYLRTTTSTCSPPPPEALVFSLQGFTMQFVSASWIPRRCLQRHQAKLFRFHE